MRDRQPISLVGRSSSPTSPSSYRVLCVSGSGERTLRVWLPLRRALKRAKKEAYFHIVFPQPEEG